MSTSATIGDIASVATAVGVFLGVLGLRHGRLQTRQEFEETFVQRYWNIMDRLSLGAQLGETATTLSEDDRKALLAYIVLSEDEAQLREDGWITRRTWRIWASGMADQFRQWPFSEAWQQAQAWRPDRFRCLQEVMKDPEFDPCQIWGPRQWIRGL
jgi:hypothetical protein